MKGSDNHQLALNTASDLSRTWAHEYAKRLGSDGVDLVARSKMGPDLLIAERRLDVRDQVSRADDLVTVTPNPSLQSASTMPT
jgi:hypothetical protein